MRLDIYREILFKINKESNIDKEYIVDASDLEDKFKVNSSKELREFYSSMYFRNKFYNLEDETTLENPFLIRIDLKSKTLTFSLNPIWKRKLFFKGKSISESLIELWNILTKELSDTTYNKTLDLLKEDNNDFTDLKQKLKKITSIKGGYNQMVIIGLIERSKDTLELRNLATKYKLFEDTQSLDKKLDSELLTLEEYKNELRAKVNSYPSYKRMSILGFINRATSKEELINIFDKESIDEDVMKRIGDSFNEKREKREIVNIVLDDKELEVDSFKSEVRQKVMKMSTFNKMTILGYISRASSKEEILELIKKYKIK